MSQMFIPQTENILRPQIPIQMESSYDFMAVLRVILYIIVIVKLVELSFLRRKKQGLKERIYRKFIFSHHEIIKQFTEEDKIAMQIVINNTMKNAKIQNISKPQRKRQASKSVSFATERNNYYEPANVKKMMQNVDEQLFTDIDDDTALNFNKSQPFQEKKIEDEFQEREELQGINQKVSEINEQESKLTQQTQSTQQSSLLETTEPKIQDYVEELQQNPFQNIQSINELLIKVQ